MAKSRIFQVQNNRIQFKCAECGAKRNLPVPLKVRRRGVRCHKCGTITECKLNRRNQQRQMQSGKATVIIRDGRELDIDLHDISPAGLGFDVAYAAVRKFSVRQEVQFRCSWNPNLFSQGRYVICNIAGNRVGVRNVAYKSLR